MKYFYNEREDEVIKFDEYDRVVSLFIRIGSLDEFEEDVEEEPYDEEGEIEIVPTVNFKEISIDDVKDKDDLFEVSLTPVTPPVIEKKPVVISEETPEEKKERKAAYMRDWYQKKKDKDKVTPTESLKVDIVQQPIVTKKASTGYDAGIVERYGFDIVDEVVTKFKEGVNAEDIYYGDNKHCGFLAVENIEEIIEAHNK